MIAVDINLPASGGDGLSGYFLSDNNQLRELLDIQDSLVDEGYECHLQFGDKRSKRIPIQFVLLFKLL